MIPIVTCLIEGTRYAVVNVNTFDNVDRSQLVETAADFEGETTENRLARRRRNWTPEAVGRKRGLNGMLAGERISGSVRPAHN